MKCILKLKELPTGMYEHTCEICGKTYVVRGKVLITECGEYGDLCLTGCQLHKLLHTLGINPVGDCDCISHANEMDERGIDWCRNNFETILGWMREAAKERGIPFIEIAAKLLIKQAISLAEKEIERAIRRNPSIHQNR